MAFCGLDFGTSNTALGTFADGAPVLIPLDAGIRQFRARSFSSATAASFGSGGKR
jgi:hypothetical protein